MGSPSTAYCGRGNGPIFPDICNINLFYTCNAKASVYQVSSLYLDLSLARTNGQTNRHPEINVSLFPYYTPRNFNFVAQFVLFLFDKLF